MIFQIQLPPLREELTVRDGPRLHDGQPSWTLQDPARNRFFRLDWLTFEILRRWSLGQPALIARTIGEQTPLAPTEQDVLAVLKFVSGHQLLKLAGGASAASLADQHRRSRPAWWLWLVHNYLFFRVPLLRPERLLRSLARTAAFLFRPLFWQLTALAALVGFGLLYRQWDAFKASWSDLAGVHGLVGFLLVLVGVKVVHEFGHGLAATHFGCRVPTMGIAFLVMTPVAYTDTNEAWNLTARKPRLFIGAAGMLAELGLAAWATLAWGLLPDGHLRSCLLLLATITWVKSIAINTSPMMRFDGYYLLSDALDLPNLHARSFALTRWWLREKLFALGERPPEIFRPSLRRGLVALAALIWIYRLVVFTGIAVFVYHYFFKALGLVLFAVELGWFVAFPIFSELKAWRERRAAIRHSPRLPLALGALFLLVLLVCVPFPQRVRLSGELRPAQEFKIVAPEDSRLAAFPFHDGDRVSAGQPLLALDSDPLLHRHRKALAREQNLLAALNAAAASPAQQARLPVLQAELVTAHAARAEAELALAQLQPRAPFAGVFRATGASDLHPGDTVARREQLGTLVADGAWTAVAYLGEQDAHLVADRATARFYPEGLGGSPVSLRVVSIEADASRTLAHPALASLYGGTVAAHLVDNDLVPDQAVYRITFAADPLPAKLTANIRRGRVAIDAGRESLLARFGRHALSVAWREIGF